MNKLQWVTGLSLVTLLLGSCTSDRKISQAPTPKPSVGQVTIDPKLPAPIAPQTTQPTSGLILPKRAIDLPIPQGRPDPFGSIAIAPVKQPVSPETARSQQTTQQTGHPKRNPATPDGTSSANTNPQQTGNGNQQSPQGKVTPGNPKSPSQGKVTPSNPKSPPQKFTTPKPHPLLKSPNPDQPLNVPPAPAPSTEIASAVEVTGVMSVGGKVSALVKTPNEPSRSVSAGEYLSGGAVRVKRIELGINRDPVVVLEQNGVEVIKAVSSNHSPMASL